MSCDHVRESASAWLDGDLTEFEAGAVAAHVARCEACAGLVLRMREVVDALQSLREPASGDLSERVLAAVPLPARPVPRRSGDLRRVAGWALIVAGCAWQLGGGALAARAVTSAAPVLAEARETVERTRQAGLASELARTTEGVTGLARGVASARRLIAESAPAPQPAP